MGEREIEVERERERLGGHNSEREAWGHNSGNLTENDVRLALEQEEKVVRHTLGDLAERGARERESACVGEREIEVERERGRLGGHNSEREA